jgi:hypothetical protein
MPRHSRSPRATPADKFLITTTLTEERRRALEQQYEAKAAQARLEALRRRGQDEAYDAQCRQQRAKTALALCLLEKIAEGEGTIPGVPASESARVAQEALANIKEVAATRGTGRGIRNAVHDDRLRFNGLSLDDVHDAIEVAVAASQARNVQERCRAELQAIFNRSTSGERCGVTERQGAAWILNEILDEYRGGGVIHKHAGARIVEKDPTTFQELVEKAHRKLRPGGNLEAARAVLAREALIRESAAGPMSDRQYDELIGPWNRKGGRSISLKLGVRISRAFVRSAAAFDASLP